MHYRIIYLFESRTSYMKQTYSLPWVQYCQYSVTVGEYLQYYIYIYMYISSPAYDSFLIPKIFLYLTPSKVQRSPSDENRREK